MMNDDEPKQIGDAAFEAVSNIADEFVGDLNSFRRLNHFFEHETSHLPPFAISRLKAAVQDLYEVCESHIEMIAMVKMMAINVAAAGMMPHYPIATKSRSKTAIVSITPQVQLGGYRADFIVDSPLGHAFLVECDGRDFHDKASDDHRDFEIERLFGMKTFRLTGREIWTSDAWLPMFGRWCRGQLFDRKKDVWLQEMNWRLDKGDGK